MQTAQERIEAVMSRSPFGTSSLPPSQLEHDSRLFVEMFSLAVETADDRDEEWAYLEMKEAYVRLLSNPPLDPDHDLPLGMWEAMQWAAELRAAMSNLTSTRS